jgi:type II secretory pathway component PulC
MVNYSDRNWAGDKEHQRSVSSHDIYLLRVSLIGKVWLSSDEAKYYAVIEEANEVIFVLQILKSLGVKTELQAIINVDNVGATIMTTNI